jgi:glycosyltransferase involved in cell wall biosynthesis
MTTRILLLSFYYPPDLAAGSFRMEALVKALLKESSNNVQIDVITTQPNRYLAYTAAAADSQQSPTLNIRRIGVRPHKSGYLDQARAFASYASGACKAVRGKKYDLIVASSSRLMTASLGAYIAFRSKTALYLDIRDIFVDILPELFPGRLGWLAAKTFRPIEGFTIRQAKMINLTSPGFFSYFYARYPDKAFSMRTNGVDELFLSPPPPKHIVKLPGDVINVVYAGNIGAGQGLDLILPQMAKRLEGVAYFYIVGAGGGLDNLRQALQLANVSNVELIAPMERSGLLAFYQKADVLFVHLNSFKSLHRVIPSKVFEYAATGKPILAGVSGYTARFITTNIINATVFEPCDVDGAVTGLKDLSLNFVRREAFVKNYSRLLTQKGMARDVLGMCHTV